MNKKLWQILSTLMIVALLATACAAPATTAPATAAPATAAPATAICSGVYAKLNVEPNAEISFSGWGDESEQSVWREAIARFNQVCPGVKVNYLPVTADFQTKLKAQMAANQAPDTFYVDVELLTAFAPNGKMLALDDYMAQVGTNKSDYIEALLGEFTYNGMLYALPKDFNTLGLVYLPEMFEAAGVAEPTPEWTYDDMRTAAMKLTKTGVAGYCQTSDSARWAPVLFAYGGDFTTPDWTKATFNTPEAVQSLQLLADMKFKDKSLVQPSDIGAGWCGEALGKKLTAMTFEGSWVIPFLAQTYPDVKYKIVTLPKGPQGLADVLFTVGIGVAATTKYPNASAALAMYLTGSENQEAILQTGFALPTVKALLDHPWFNDHPDVAAVVEMGKIAKLGYWGPKTGTVYNVVSAAVERVWLGQMDVQESLDKGVADLDILLQSP